MYKIINHSNNQIDIQERFNSPMVYLDHWALNDFCLDSELRTKFIKLMNEKGGTFRLSVVNMSELSNQSDRKQTDSIIEMIKCIDDCGLINIDPGKVIRKENILIADPSSISVIHNPSANLELVSEYLKIKNYPKKLHVSEIISFVIDDFPSANLAKINQKFLKEMQQLLNAGRTDNNLIKASNRFKKLKNKGPKYQAPTREILQMSLDFVMRHKKMNMSNYNEWNDLFHLIVPVAYCDIVLMDRRWKAFIEQTGFSYPKIAKVYDKRSINDFFKTVETWKYIKNLRPN